MAFTTTSAIAVTFAWAAAPACWRITISGTDYDVTVDALAAARMCLGRAPGGSLGTNGAIDFVRHVEAAINTAVGGSGRTFTLTWGTDDRLTLAVDSGTFTLAHLTTAGLLLSRVLGWLSTGSGISSRTAVDPPWYFATAIAMQASVLRPNRAGAAERDAAGRVYAFGAGTTSYDRRLALPRIPRQPVVCTDEGCHATPLLPADEYLHDPGGTDTQRRWSWLDVIEASRNTTVALALYTWQTFRGGDEAESYLEGYLSSDTLQHENEPEFRDARWPVWAQHEVTHVLPGIGEAVTANRA